MLRYKKRVKGTEERKTVGHGLDSIDYAFDVAGFYISFIAGLHSANCTDTSISVHSKFILHQMYVNEPQLHARLQL